MTFNKFNFIISKILPKNSTRPEISGVFFQPNKTTATDSFRLIEVSSVPSDKNESFKPFILEKQGVEALLKAEIFNIKDQTNGAVGFGDEKQTIAVLKISGEYPKTNEVMQEKGKYASVRLNPKYLKEMMDFYSKFSEQEIEMRVPINQDSPIFFLAENKETKQKSKGALMPIRNS